LRGKRPDLEGLARPFVLAFLSEFGGGIPNTLRHKKKYKRAILLRIFKRKKREACHFIKNF